MGSPFIVLDSTKVVCRGEIKYVFHFSDDNNLQFGTIICCMGVRYKSYCSNIVRTLMVDPTDNMQKNYEFLTLVEEEIQDKLRDG